MMKNFSVLCVGGFISAILTTHSSFAAPPKADLASCQSVAATANKSLPMKVYPNVPLTLLRTQCRQAGDEVNFQFILTINDQSIVDNYVRDKKQADIRMKNIIDSDVKPNICAQNAQTHILDLFNMETYLVDSTGKTLYSYTMSKSDCS